MSERDWREYVETWEAKLDQQDTALAERVEAARKYHNEWVFDSDRKQIAEARACIAEIREKILGEVRA